MNIAEQMDVWWMIYGWLIGPRGDEGKLYSTEFVPEHRIIMMWRSAGCFYLHWENMWQAKDALHGQKYVDTWNDSLHLAAEIWLQNFLPFLFYLNIFRGAERWNNHLFTS